MSVTREHFIGRVLQLQAQSPSNLPGLQQHADETTRRMNALSELLGEEKLERFQVFEMNRSGRYWVSQFSTRLAPADQLQPDQEDRLTALKREQFQIPSSELGPWRVLRPSMSIEDMRRDAQRQSLIANENFWRKRQVANRVLEQKAAAFLTPSQLAALSNYHAQEQDTQRRYIESERAQAGMDPQMPEKPEVVEETPKLLEAQVQVELSVTVNREPTTVTRTVRSGESFTFAVAQGLIAEATPMMFNDDWIEVHLNYYEEGTTGRRRLSGGSIATAQVRQPDGSLASGGNSGAVISGRRGYAVETSVSATLL